MQSSAPFCELTGPKENIFKSLLAVTVNMYPPVAWAFVVKSVAKLFTMQSDAQPGSSFTLQILFPQDPGLAAVGMVGCGVGGGVGGGVGALLGDSVGSDDTVGYAVG